MNKKSVFGVIIALALAATIAVTTSAIIQQLANALVAGDTQRKAPVAISGDNIYIAWWTNKTGNDEVMFRASNDAGVTFGDKINLSNTTGANSQDAEMAADGSNVVVTWWERNQTANEPAVRISTDNGQTFGPILKLAANGTIGTEAEERE
jgi:archaellin